MSFIMRTRGESPCNGAPPLPHLVCRVPCVGQHDLNLDFQPKTTYVHSGIIFQWDKLVVMWEEMWGPEENPDSAPQNCSGIAPHCPPAPLKHSLKVAHQSCFTGVLKWFAKCEPLPTHPGPPNIEKPPMHLLAQIWPFPV